MSFIACAHLKNATKNKILFSKKGWAYNVSKSAVVTASRCMSSSESAVKILCLCPSVAATPILKGCTEKELEEMRDQVGGIMTIDQVPHCNKNNKQCSNDLFGPFIFTIVKLKKRPTITTVSHTTWSHAP